jgi:hypothetical protein
LLLAADDDDDADDADDGGDVTNGDANAGPCVSQCNIVSSPGRKASDQGRKRIQLAEAAYTLLSDSWQTQSPSKATLIFRKPNYRKKKKP